MREGCGGDRDSLICELLDNAPYLRCDALEFPPPSELVPTLHEDTIPIFPMIGVPWYPSWTVGPEQALYYR